MTIPAPPDNCPECLTAKRAVTVFPRSVVTDGTEAVASYHCPECGNDWTCGWRLDVLGQAA